MAHHHTSQHFVPRGYLAAWCDPNTPTGQEPYVWMFPAQGGSPRRKPPFKIFREDDIYTDTFKIDGLEHRDVGLELSLKSLEDNFYRVRNDFIAHRRALPVLPRLKLLAFVAAQRHRTPRARDDIRQQFGRMLDMMEDMRTSMQKLSREERLKFARGQLPSTGPTLSYEDVRLVAEKPMQVTLASHVRKLVPILDKMNVWIFCAPKGSTFITSDDPCVWFDPEAYKRPAFYQSPALMYPTIEITMPISPDRMLLICHRKGGHYVNIPTSLVHELNRRTRVYANEYFVSNNEKALAS